MNMSRKQLLAYIDKNHPEGQQAQQMGKGDSWTPEDADGKKKKKILK